MSLYLQCFLISFLGLLFSQLVILKNLTKKAKLANVIFNWKLYFAVDLWISMAATIVATCILLMLLGPFLTKFPKYADATLFILVIFATTGYVGSDLVARAFSQVNSRINNAIDLKTTQADTLTGNLDAPTPAEKPKTT